MIGTMTAFYHHQDFFLLLKVVLFMRKLSYILEHCCECKGKYELVFLSETDTKKIADVVVGMYKDTKRCLERQVGAN